MHGIIHFCLWANPLGQGEPNNGHYHQNSQLHPFKSKGFSKRCLEGRALNKQTYYSTMMSSGRRAACFRAFYALLKEAAPFISNKKPVKAERFITFIQDWDSPARTCLFLSDMICHLSDNGCIMLETRWKFQEASKSPFYLSAIHLQLLPSAPIRTTALSTMDESDMVLLHYWKLNSVGLESVFLPCCVHQFPNRRRLFTFWPRWHWSPRTLKHSQLSQHAAIIPYKHVF